MRTGFFDQSHFTRAFIAAYERRLEQEVTHPLFGYRVSKRRLLEVQARLFARYLGGERTSTAFALENSFSSASATI